MAPLTRTIVGRLMIGVLSIHLVLIPVLVFGMVFIIRQSNEEAFLNHVRGQARFLADSLERRGAAASDEEVIEVLDSIVLSGSGIYSELQGNDRRLLSSLVTATDADAYEEDFGLAQNNDGIYYFSVPVVGAEQVLNLRVGFDEAPLVEQNRAAYRHGIIVIAGYIVLLLALLPLIGRHVAKPIRRLQQASRLIASGQLDEDLSVESDLVELVELSRDLNLMKRRLTGINEQLEKEIHDREEAVLQRLSMEQLLRHSQRLETIGTMAGGIAHELNNILVPIILHAEMALEDADEVSDIRSDLETVLAAANRARTIVNQVLTFSHRSGEVAGQPVDMAAIVRESTTLLRSSKPPDATLEVDVDPDCPAVLGDPALVGQLVLNLCNNAIQALPDGEGRIRVSLAVIDAESELLSRNPALRGTQCVCLTVQDDGEGMDDATRHRIFEPFFTTRDVGKGTGLGLSVVHGIVNDLNGVIDVVSTAGSGSVFRVFLPAYESRSNAEPVANSR